MKRIFHIVLTILALVGLFSCEKIIYVDLNEAEQQMVVEAVALNNQGSFVKLSRTGSYYQSEAFEKVSGGLVNIKDDSGNSYLFSETEPGCYSNSDFIAIPDQHYHLSVDVENKQITSTSVMPHLVSIDSLTYEIEAGRLGFRERMTIKCHYSDPDNEDNFYLLKVYQNGVRVSDFEVKSDRIDNGNATYFSYGLEDYQYGDLIDIEFYCIDETNYKYFDLNSNGPGMRQSAAPGNPVSNIEGEAIGIFGAYTISKGSVLLTE